MSTEGVIVEDTMSCGYVSGSPKNKVKFLCSHGGRILPRPADGQLKYVGGETRIISVPTDIKFQEIMKKLTYLIESDMILKYQLVTEDLDALVSVRSDEDLRNMFDEYDRYESTGTTRFRAFLFPAHPVVIENHAETNAVEQRYIDAINGIVRVTHASTKHHFLNTNLNASSIMSSSSTSPRTPESNYADAIPPEAMPPPPMHNYHSGHYGSRGKMQRVHSSPNMYNLNNPPQISPKYSHQHHKHLHNYCHSNRQPPPYYQSSKLLIDPHKGSNGHGHERLISVRSVGIAEGIRYQVDHAMNNHYSSKYTGGNGCCSPKCVHLEEYASCSSDRRMERASSLSPSPLSLSPRQGQGHGHGHIVYKVCDS